MRPVRVRRRWRVSLGVGSNARQEPQMVSPFVVLKPPRQYLKSRGDHLRNESVVGRKVAIRRAVALQIPLLRVERSAQLL